MFRKLGLLLIVMSSICYTATAQHARLRQNIKSLQDSSKGKLGVFIKVLETGDTITFEDQRQYVMQSVFKFPIALAVLDRIDAGTLKLGDSIYVKKEELRKTVSLLYDKYAGRNVKITIQEMLTDMVTLSDNNACDILLRVLGGPKQVEHYIHRLKVLDIEMKYNERQMNTLWTAQYHNWCRPSAQGKLLELLSKHQLLSSRNNALLQKLMLETYVAPKRIRYLLPVNTPVGHRSGTSGTNDTGLSPGTNDIGMITLPNGKHLIVAIFLTDSYATDGERDHIIARIAKIAYDEFNQAD